MTASEKILQKALVGSNLDSRQWNSVQAGLRDRAFFSSQVASMRVLHAAREMVAERAGGDLSASDFRLEMRKVLGADGYDAGENRGTIKDLMTKARLDVIQKTNVEQARGYIHHLEATAPGAFAAFPAQELVRVRQRKQPRDWAKRWKDNGGKLYEGRMIAIVDDPIWTAISDFGNPFPPYAFGSGMGVRAVKKSEAVRLGVISADEVRAKVEKMKAEPAPGFNANLQATVPNLRSDSLCGKILKKNFGDQVKIENSVVSWEGNLVQDLVAGLRKKVNLGTGYNGESVSLSRQFFVEHGSKHLDPNEPYEHLEKQDFELVPWIWRKPDRVLPTRDPNRKQLELDTFDDWTLLMIVDGRNGIKSIQKRKSPGGSTV